MRSPLYDGPLARLLGGADLSWVLGFPLSAAIYVGLARLKARRTVSISRRGDSGTRLTRTPSVAPGSARASCGNSGPLTCRLIAGLTIQLAAGNDRTGPAQAAFFRSPWALGPM